MSPARIRVIVALDPEAPKEEAFEALASMFDGEHLEVTALFIEDTNLTRLADLPGLHEICIGARPRRRPLNAPDMQAQLRTREARMRRTCEIASVRLRLPHARFLVLQGEVLAELERAGADADLLVVARSLRSAAARSWLGAGPERLAWRLGRLATPGALLFVHEPWRTGSSVLVVEDGSEDAARGRMRAEALARSEGIELQTLTSQTGLPALDELARACAAADARVLVLPRSAVGDDPLALTQLVAALPASVLLTR